MAFLHIQSLLLSALSILQLGRALENKTFYCEQFYKDIRNRTGFMFDINDNSPIGLELRTFDSPATYEDRVYMTSPDAEYVNFRGNSLTVQRSLRSRNGETLHLTGTCVGLFEDYNFTAQFKFEYFVNIIDVNDAPVFSNLPATVEVYENMTVGSIVYQVVVDDSLDLDRRFWTNYISIEKVTGLETSRTSPSRSFLMTDSGHIRLLERLDYELGPRIYKVIINAQDGGSPLARNQSRLVIRVLDVDDMPPEFTEESYSARVIGEKPLTGQEECFNSTPRLFANDLDRDVKSKIFYDIIDGEPGTRDYWGQYFRIEPTSGMLCQLQMIQRLLIDPQTGRNVFFNFTFTIRASQADNPQKYDTSKLFVEVVDENQHSPTFSKKLYRASLPEYPLSRDGAIVLRVDAVDRDFGMNSEFVYTLLKNPGGVFSVDPHSGDISVTRSNLLDREAGEYIELSVQAKETRTIDENSDVTRVLIHVLDVNDNSPKFTNDTYRYTIKDTAEQRRPIHKFADRPHAFDIDAGDNGRVEYRIERIQKLGDNAGFTYMADMGRFSVDPDSGVITLSGSLRDLRRKRTYPVYHLELTARDRPNRDTDTLSSTADVFVTIQHANDHPPSFTPKVTGSRIASQHTPGVYHVTENALIGTMIAQFQAADADGDEDIFLTYWISAGDEDGLFDVTNDGRLVVRQPPDREGSTFHQLIVMVTDGFHNVSTTVDVFVDDENDNAPRFEQEEYSFTIPESSSAGTVVGQTVATDADLAEGGEITYSIKHGPAADVFAIQKGGIITIEHETQLLDRETNSKISLKIIATDHGKPPLKSVVDVTVYLDDVNDNVPVLSRAVYHGTVDEGEGQGRRVVMETSINATDADAMPENRHISFSLLGDGSDVFSIGSGDAQIKVVDGKILDAESRQQYKLKLMATDKNGTGMSSYADVIIKVKDINDNSPRFHGDTSIEVENNVPIGQTIGSVTATDDDVTEENNRVIYILRAGGYGKFAVGFETGAITVSDVIDREPYRKYYSLHVDALDSGLPRRMNTTVVKITVPTNRRPVIADYSLQMEAREDLAVNTPIGQVEATDPDADPGHPVQLRYHIDKDDVGVPFRVRGDSGHVLITSPLDYESWREYSFVVHVTDEGGMMSNGTVRVLVRDVRDDPPVFLLPLYRGTVREDDTHPDPGQMVVMPVNISAIYLSASPGIQRATLSLHGPDSDYFYVDPLDDVIRVSAHGAGRIDRETREKFDLVVRATDNLNPNLTAEVDCVIYVNDVNDNGPLYVASPNELIVHENVQVGDVIGQILADDADSTSPNNDVMYILESDPFGKFRLDINTGSISVLSGLFFQPRQLSYDLVITAIDLGYPRRKAQKKVSVRVLKKDFPDLKPEFLGDTIFQTVEEVPIDTVIGTLKFTAEELSPAESVRLKITSNTSVPFAIDPRSGDLRVTSRLDSDAGPRVYTFIVSATDSKNPLNQAKTTVGVIIQDVNDNPPKFTQYEYHHRVASGFPAGTVVATPFAYDDIDIEQSRYTYSLKGDDVGTFFTIDPKTGLVTTTDALADVTYDIAEFALVAQDVREVSLVALARLVIDIERTADPGPCFPEESADDSSSTN